MERLTLITNIYLRIKLSFKDYWKVFGFDTGL